MLTALIVLVCLLLIGITVFFSIYFSVRLDKTTIIAQRSNLEVYDINNNPLKTMSADEYVTYDKISSNIINAFVSLEDKRFFRHNGVDYIRLGGAVTNNIKAGYFKEGGSTITQQLAKNAQLSNEKTIKRKIKELKIAKDIERQYSKEEIIEMYLNYIYFGSGIYGIDSACKAYFNKTPLEVNVLESAILAGIVKNPSKYSPFLHPEEVNKRKDLVLKLMYEQKYITESEYQTNKAKGYEKIIQKTDINAPYYNNVIAEASEILGISEKNIIVNNYKIFTYYDSTTQKVLFDGFQSSTFNSVNSNGIKANYSALLVDNYTGGVSAYYDNIGLNINQNYRLPGSVIKPIAVYAPALEKGIINPSTPINDSPININGYQPNNYNGKFYGWIDASTALMKSSNSVAVQLLNSVSVPTAKEISRKMGIKYGVTDNNLAIALGGMEHGVTFSQITNAYMCLANQGEYKNSRFIAKIIDKNGNTVYQNTSSKTTAITPESAYLTTEMLINTAKNGTAKALASLPYQIASKTGTVSYGSTSKNTDAWNLSYTRDNTLCVWYGDMAKTNNTALEITGGGLPTHFAKYVYNSLDYPNNSFEVPSNIEQLEVDAYATKLHNRLLLANNFTPSEYRKTANFDKKYLPVEISQEFMNEADFQLKVENNQITASIQANPAYRYVLIKENMFNNLKYAITDYVLTDNEYHFVDNTLDKNGIYSYHFEVYNNNELLYNTPNKLIFT